jgi:pSer/pThr/pTyr-binding forkhead associated (FHA) protein
MGKITIQVLEGFERGRVFADLPTPVTIGREEDNTIQLNDERVSRFHVKIQEDAGRVILTDLDSTNGTRINGHPVQMRVLQFGDQLSIGRSILLYGSAEEIESSNTTPAGEQRGRETVDPPANHKTLPEPIRDISDLAGTQGLGHYGDDARDLFPKGPPDVPRDLKIAQVAQLSDMLAYIHDQLALLLETAIEEKRGNISQMRVDWEAWQRLLKLEMQLASYLREIADPHRGQS